MARNAEAAELAVVIGDSDARGALDAAYDGHRRGVKVSPQLFMGGVEAIFRQATNCKFTWASITSRPDYNLIRFRKRRWPYFEVTADECKEWKENVANNRGYPEPLLRGNDEEEDIPYSNFSAYEPRKGDVNDLLVMLKKMKTLGVPTDKFLYQMMITPDLCHVIKRKEFWDMCSLPPDVVTHGLYYAMYILAFEEMVRFSKVTVGHRSVFTHNEALLIPNHPTHVQTDPFIQQLTDNRRISDNVALHMRGNRRLTTPAEFSRRLYLATGGCLEGINFGEMGAAVSGSILIPCACVTPLEDNFKSKYWGVLPKQESRWAGKELSREDKEFLLYCEYYYPSVDSLEKVEKKSKSISDIDISVTVSSGAEFRVAAANIFRGIKKNCPTVKMDMVETGASFKYVIYGPDLLRPIDLFQIYYHASVMTKKFYFGCVKMWIGGTVGANPKLYMHRECVAALLSGVNERYSWFSCNKIPVDTECKYMIRGFPVILNDVEKQNKIAFLETSKKWSIGTDIFGEVSPKHSVFSDDQVGVRYGLLPFRLVHRRLDTQLSVKREYPRKVKSGTATMPPLDWQCLDDA